MDVMIARVVDQHLILRLGNYQVGDSGCRDRAIPMTVHFLPFDAGIAVKQPERMPD
jgi:hypothetical protein